MSKNIFKNEIVVDITDLPTKIKDLLYNRYKGCSNGGFRNYYIHDEQKTKDEYNGGEILHVDKINGYIVERGDDPISDYFYDQGMKNREKISIKIWW